MSYLVEEDIVHRDLAARNVLMDHNGVCKVSDFGLSRDVDDKGFYQRHAEGQLLPLKWMALESILYRVYTTKSDVWSYGVVLWEIWELGASPYSDINLNLLPDMLQKGYRLSKPQQATDDLYKIMLACWAADPVQRPDFVQVSDRLAKLTKSGINALDSKDCVYASISPEDKAMRGLGAVNNFNEIAAMLAAPIGSWMENADNPPPRPSKSGLQETKIGGGKKPVLKAAEANDLYTKPTKKSKKTPQIQPAGPPKAGPVSAPLGDDVYSNPNAPREIVIPAGSNMYINWKEDLPCHHGDISRDESAKVLRESDIGVGAYLIRDKASDPGDAPDTRAYALSVLREGGKVNHHLLKQMADGKFTFNNESCGSATTLEEVIEFARTKLTHPLTHGVPCKTKKNKSSAGAGDMEI